MAQSSTFKAMAIVFAVAMFAVAMFSVIAVSAQDFEAPAPAPAMDKGAAFAQAISGAVICSSVVLSLFALLKH